MRVKFKYAHAVKTCKCTEVCTEVFLGRKAITQFECYTKISGGGEAKGFLGGGGGQRLSEGGGLVS